MKSKLLFLSYKAELMQNLHVRPNFIFEFLCSTLIVSENFLKFYFKTLCPNIFPTFPPNVFFFSNFFILVFFLQNFYTNILYLNKFVQVNFDMISLHVYILYIILYLNKLYNFQFSLSYCDLDLTCYY